VPVISSDFNKTSLSEQLSVTPSVLNVKKMRPVEAYLYYTDGRTDRNDEGHSPFGDCECA
jgi:hypothetical protein